MSEWFESKIKFLRQMDNGLVKPITETYLVDAMSFTECEARVTKEVGEGMREVTMMTEKRSNIKEVVFYGDTDVWHKCKVCYNLMDEDTEKEKKITTYLLVNSHDVREAYERCAEHLKEMLVPFTIPQIVESPIIDVYQYEQALRPKAFDTVAQDLQNEAQTKADALIEKLIGKPADPESLKLTNQLIERREQVKQLLGDDYAERIAANVPVIHAEMQLSGHDSPLKAVIAISNKKELSEIYGSVLLACAADMMEGKIKPADPTNGQAVAFSMKKTYMEDGGMSDNGEDDSDESREALAAANGFDADDWFDGLDRADQDLILQRYEEIEGYDAVIAYLMSGWNLPIGHAQEVENILGSKESRYGSGDGMNLD